MSVEPYPDGWIMEQYDESTYGDSIAEIYDELYAEYDPTAVDLL